MGKTQTFDKGYVVQRIEARMASLASRVEQRQGIIDEIEKTLDMSWVDNLDRETKLITLPEVTRQAAQKAKTFDEKIAVISEFNGKIAALGSKKGLDYQTGNLRSDALQEKRRFQAEIYTLEHALAYLKESPIDEYSVTSLQRLGLLEAVKFALTPEQESERNRRFR